jgi:nitrogen fixation NifU-like protein
MPILEHTMYPERLLDHFTNPRNVGELAPPAVTVEASNPACGDVLRLSARFEGGVAVEVGYSVRGCTASIAAGSALTEWMRGKTRGEIAAFQASIVDEAVGGLPAASKHAATLCADGVRLLLRRTQEGRPGGPPHWAGAQRQE